MNYRIIFEISIKIIIIIALMTGVASADKIIASDNMQQETSAGADLTISGTHNGSYKVYYGAVFNAPNTSDDIYVDIYLKLNGVLIDSQLGGASGTPATNQKTATIVGNLSNGQVLSVEAVGSCDFSCGGGEWIDKLGIILYYDVIPIPSNNNITSPVNNYYTSNPAMNITWTTSTGATNYHWQTSTSSTFATNYSQGNTSNLYAGTQTIQTNGYGNWYFRVRPNNTGEIGNWSTTNTITYVSLNTTFNNITSPLNLYTTSNPNIGITWNANVGTNDSLTKTYNWQFSNSSTFATIYSQANTTSTSVTNFTFNYNITTWYLRVKVNNTYQNGSWSPTSQVVVVRLANPPNSTLTQNLVTSALLNLTWNATTGNNDTTTKTYNWQISTTSNFVTIYNQSNTTNRYSSPTKVTATGIYYVRVKANNTFNDSDWGNLSTFTIIQPNASTITYPLNSSYQNNYTLNITWTQLVDWNGTSSSVSYNWQISNNSGFANISAQGNVTNQLYSGLVSLPLNLTYFVRVMTNNTMLSSNWSNANNFTQVRLGMYPLFPLNNSTNNDISVILQWTEDSQGSPYYYQLASDNQFINIISSGSEVSVSGALKNSSTLGLIQDVTYYWRVKNTTGNYSSTFEFDVGFGTPIPGTFNITAYDEVNQSLRVMNFSVQFYNTTSYIIRNTTTGWVNVTPADIGSGYYLAILIPNAPYYQRMLLSLSPGNATFYIPNSTNATIDLIMFTLLDVTGRFPYQNSTMTILKGGLIMDKSYFSADGTHSVYLIQGSNYQIIIQNGLYVQVFDNFIPLSSGTSTITINDFSVNTTLLNPFAFNVSYNINAVTLNWSAALNTLTSLNFTVHKGMPMVEVCQFSTVIQHGQAVCSIDNSTTYHVIVSILKSDGTFRNYSTTIDYTQGHKKASTGTSVVDGSPTGVGYKWNYGTFTMPDWVYNWVSLILIIILAGSFGGYYSGFGGIITLFVALILELIGWFQPLGDSDLQVTAVMGITGGLLFMAILYFLQHKDKGG